MIGNMEMRKVTKFNILQNVLQSGINMLKTYLTCLDPVPPKIIFPFSSNLIILEPELTELMIM